ncbi:MAG: hypothetical protein NTW03_21795 [Verrucomicrobia bacterium]|nr:hypothetical protein [Verrucomicrobiota bacterium]
MTVISWIALVAGGLTFLIMMTPDFRRNQAEYKSQHAFLYFWFYAGPVVAVICGAFMLRGFNWARWLLVLWFGYNVIGNIGRLPSRQLPAGLLVRCLFGAAVYLLFRPASTAFFRSCALEVPKNQPTQPPPISPP